MEALSADVNREVIFTSLVKHMGADEVRGMSVDVPLMEGNVVAVEVESASGYALGTGLLNSSFVEDRSGVLRVLYDGAIVVTALGSRESTYWSVADLHGGTGPRMQLVSHAGLCSYIRCGSAGKTVAVRVLGTVLGPDGAPINIKSRSMRLDPTAQPRKRPVSVFVGTSAEVGKTTSLLHLLQGMRRREPVASILAVKMSGTPSEAEINLYKSYGASEAINLIDLGFPSSYTTDRQTLMERYCALFASQVFQSADHALLELGGDVIGANNLGIIELLMESTAPQFFLAAFDGFGAEGCSRYLRGRGVEVAAVTGKCVANPIVKRRTGELCQALALSALDANDLDTMMALHQRERTAFAAVA